MKQIGEVGVTFQQGSVGHREFTCIVHLSDSSVPRPLKPGSTSPSRPQGHIILAQMTTEVQGNRFRSRHANGKKQRSEMIILLETALRGFEHGHTSVLTRAGLLLDPEP